MKKIKLLNILNKLSPLDNVESIFEPLEKELADVSARLKEVVKAKTLEQANEQFRKLKNTLKLEPIIEAFEKLKRDLDERDKTMLAEMQERVKTLNKLFENVQDMHADKMMNVGNELALLKSSIKALENKKITFPDFTPQITRSENSLKELMSTLENSLNKKIKDKSDLERFKKKVEEDMAELNQSLNRTKEMSGRGGNANRNIAVGGNTSMLSRYTDINIKPGSNVTLTYSNNNTSKYLDLTIAATGGAGTSRSINTVSVSSVLADTAATDIVVLANAGVRLTLPTAVSNTNLYTIKNIGSSSVLIATTGVETIDSDTTLIMPVQYTAVDIISDNTNWHIT